MQVHEKVEKSRNSVFPMFCGTGGSKSRLAKAAGAEPSGLMRNEKLHDVVARSEFRSQNAKNTSCLEHSWELRRWKNARRCGLKHISKSKCTKHNILGALFEVEMMKSVRRCGAKRISKSKCRKHSILGALFEAEMMKKCTALRREAHFQVKMYKTPQVWSTFWSWGDEQVHGVVAKSTFPSQNVQTPQVQSAFGNWDVEKVHGAVARSTFRSENAKATTCSCHFWKGFCTLLKVSKTWGFCSSFKNDGRLGTYAEDLTRCLSCGRRSTRDMFIRAVRRSERWFPQRGCILEHQIFRFAKMILHDGWSTSNDLASLFRGRRNTLDTWTGKIAIALVRGRQLCLYSTFHFWRRSSRIPLFFMSSTSKIEGSLAALHRFWRC